MHFAATVLHVERPAMRWVLATLVAGAVGVLLGLPGGWPWLAASGATAASVAILLGYRHLRRMRKSSLGARFRFVVRAYERAHGAFLHGALLGAIMAVGVLPGQWYGGVRLAHLHVNVLGWAGVTLLATVVFFGPTVLRVRIQEGAEESAALALRWVATAVTVASFALIAIGFGDLLGDVFRVTAGLALAVAAVGVFRVLRPVVAVARGAKATSLSGLLIRDACVWFRAGVARAGVLLVVLAAALGPVVGASGAVLAEVGWGAFLGSVLAQIGLLAWPLRNPLIRS